MPSLSNESLLFNDEFVRAVDYAYIFVSNDPLRVVVKPSNVVAENP